MVAVVTVCGLSLGWVGGRAVEITLRDVRDNTVWRVQSMNEGEHIKAEILEMKSTLRDLSEMKEMLIRMDARLQQWEPTD